MPLHVNKYERYQSTDRNDLGVAALELCRAARESDGVTRSRFYWVDANEVAILVEADPGAWGTGSGAQIGARAGAAVFALADLARNTVNEVWTDAGAGEEIYRASQS